MSLFRSGSTESESRTLSLSTNSAGQYNLLGEFVHK